VVDAHSEAVDRALDAYDAAVGCLHGAGERWDGRREWASCTVAALRNSDASLTERAAIARAAALLELPAVIVEAAVAADRPAAAPPGWTEGADVAVLLRGLLQGIHHDLQHATTRVDERLEDEGRALVAFYEAVRDAVVQASKSGMSNFRIHKITGIPFDRVADMTRIPEANPAERLRWVDKFIPIRAAVWARWRGWVAGVPPVPAELRAATAALDTSDVDLLRERLVELGVEPRAAELIGKQRRALGLLWDTHLHHNDYSDPRYVRIENQLKMMRAAGHQGTVVLSPIPQRGM